MRCCRGRQALDGGVAPLVCVREGGSQAKANVPLFQKIGVFDQNRILLSLSQPNLKVHPTCVRASWAEG